ncbi:MAG: copper resistance protein NlpE N-terminal domain-containing protein [Thermoanaerobaculia bacterium]|nr:copper resistance protein NlpE N-terminal domain-containing protein [Thermoanaerobaculia bacterium]
MRMGTLQPLLLAGLLAVAPADGQSEIAAPVVADPLADLPASFAGTLPCADCPGIEIRIDLFADATFFQRSTYVGRAAAVDDIGTWRLTAERTLVLWGHGREPSLWEVVATDRLRKLDRQGDRIVSDLPYELDRLPSPQPLEPTLAMRGMYRYMADAALFQECETGRSFPVAMERESLALERAYLAADLEPAAPVMAHVEAAIAQRPPMEGEGLRPTLVVARFDGLWPGETCGARGVIADLESTRWAAVRIGDGPVAGGVGRELDLVLGADGRWRGWAGCERLDGSYERNGRSLRLSGADAASGCNDAAYLAALGAARSLRLGRVHLDLLDGDGRLVLRFEERNL